MFFSTLRILRTNIQPDSYHFFKYTLVIFWILYEIISLSYGSPPLTVYILHVYSSMLFVMHLLTRHSINIYSTEIICKYWPFQISAGVSLLSKILHWRYITISFITLSKYIYIYIYPLSFSNILCHCKKKKRIVEDLKK